MPMSQRSFWQPRFFVVQIVNQVIAATAVLEEGRALFGKFRQQLGPALLGLARQAALCLLPLQLFVHSLCDSDNQAYTFQCRQLSHHPSRLCILNVQACATTSVWPESVVLLFLLLQCCAHFGNPVSPS